MMLHLQIISLLLTGIPFFNCETDPLENLLGNYNLQLGYGQDCYLVFDKGNAEHKAMFKCERFAGDSFGLSGSQASGYKIFNGKNYLIWKKTPSNEITAEYSDKDSNNVFWIKKSDDGSVAIGFSNCSLTARNKDRAMFECNSEEPENFLLFDPLEHLYGAPALYIGYKKNCNLFWKSSWESSSTKSYNAEFHCNTELGDPIWIERIKSGENKGKVKLGSGFLNFAWDLLQIRTKNAFFTEYPGKAFLIKKESDGLFSIEIFDKGYQGCPLVWKGMAGEVHNAEFRCVEKTYDTFWIKPRGCQIDHVQLGTYNGKFRSGGFEVIGVSTASQCSNVSSTLALSTSRSVTESFEIELGRTLGQSFQVSNTISFSGTVGIPFVSVKLGFSVSTSSGTSTTYSTSETKSSGEESGTSATSSITYQGPGGAIALGVSEKIIVDERKIPAAVTMTCSMGYMYKYKTMISLQRETFNSMSFVTATAKFNGQHCSEDTLNMCLNDIKKRKHSHFADAIKAFKKCFNDDQPVGGTCLL